jgi:hypothetical protein
MSNTLAKVALAVLFPGICPAQAVTPPEALARYLVRSRERQPGCSGLVFAVEIDASLPMLRKQGSMRGLKVVSQTGQIVYRGLRFTGDNLVKTAVIARYIAGDAEPPAGIADLGLTPQNYSFVYDKTSDYNGSAAYVFLLKPKRKRRGLFKGELWLDPTTAAPLRVWGDVIKSPSIFIRNFRFVQDYQDSRQCQHPIRLLLTVQTRIAGKAEMAVSLHPVDGAPANGFRTTTGGLED